MYINISFQELFYKYLRGLRCGGLQNVLQGLDMQVHINSLFFRVY